MKRIIVFLVLLMMGLGAEAQSDTMFYYINFESLPCEKNDAFCYRIYWQEGNYYSVRDYYMLTGSLKEAGMYSDSGLTIKSGMFEQYRLNKTLIKKGAYADGKRIGIWKGYHQNGLLADSGYYKNDVRCKYGYSWDDEGHLKDSTMIDMQGSGYSYGFYPNGDKEYFGRILHGDKRDSLWTYWHPNGQIKVLAKCERDSVLEMTCFDSLGNVKAANCIAARMAEFPGGIERMQQYMMRTLKYPDYARDHGIVGRVIIQFLVNEDGVITDIEAIKNPGGGLAEEGIRIVKQMPKWTPGVYMGKTVKVHYSLPIMFSQE